MSYSTRDLENAINQKKQEQSGYEADAAYGIDDLEHAIAIKRKEKIANAQQIMQQAQSPISAFSSGVAQNAINPLIGLSNAFIGKFTNSQLPYLDFGKQYENQNTAFSIGQIVGEAYPIVRGGQALLKGGAAIKEAYKAFRPKTQQEIQRAQKKELLTQGLSKEQKIKESEIEQAYALQKAMSENERALQQSQQELEQFGGLSETEAKRQLSSSLQQIKKDYRDQGNQMYESFKMSEAGQRKVAKPFQLFEADKKPGSAWSLLPKNSQDKMLKIIGQEKKSPLEAWGSNEIKEAPHKISDYIELNKELRDRAQDYYSEASSPLKSQMEKDAAIQNAKKISELQDKVHQHISESLSTEEQIAYNKIQEHWANMVSPFKRNPLLRNLAEGKVTSKNVHYALTKEGLSDLRNAILMQHPEFKSVLAKHDIQNINISNPKAIDKLLKSDAGRDLPIQLQRQLRNHQQLLEQQEQLAALPAKTRNKVSIAINGAALKKVFEKNPQLKEPFDNVQAEKARLQEIKLKLKEMGISEAEAAETIDGLEIAKKAAKITSKIMGGF